jgi:hypothetical protein
MSVLSALRPWLDGGCVSGPSWLEKLFGLEMKMHVTGRSGLKNAAKMLNFPLFQATLSL